MKNMRLTYNMGPLCNENSQWKMMMFFDDDLIVLDENGVSKFSWTWSFVYKFRAPTM